MKEYKPALYVHQFLGQDGCGDGGFPRLWQQGYYKPVAHR